MCGTCNFFIVCRRSNLPSELLDASSDSLSVAEEELVQVAYRKVNKKDLLGGVSSVNVEELMKRITSHTA